MPAVDDLVDIVGLIIWVGFPLAATAFGAYLAYRQSTANSRIGDLEKRLAAGEERIKAIETERDGLRHTLRVAVRHIREWLAWERSHEPGDPPPPLPEELRDEV